MNMKHYVMPSLSILSRFGFLSFGHCFWLLNVSHFGVGHPVYIVGKLKIGVLI